MNCEIKTIEDYIAYWKEQPLETLRKIATVHMGGYEPDATKDELVAYLTKGMEEYCRETDTALDTIQAIKTRYSCRAFSDRMPSDMQLKIVAEAAVASPSGMNRQLWRVIVLKNKELIDEMESEAMKNMASLPDKNMYERIMSRGGKVYYNAPCMIVVPIAKTEPAGAELFDCGIVSENIALAATSLGIDSLICGLAAFSFAGDKGAEFKERLSFPKGYEIGIAVLLGYAVNPGGKPHEPDLSKISWIE